MKPGKTITDEQIICLLCRSLTGMERCESADLWRPWAIHAKRHEDARVALGFRRARRGDTRAKARARCVEAINAKVKP